MKSQLFSRVVADDQFRRNTAKLFEVRDFSALFKFFQKMQSAEPDERSQISSSAARQFGVDTSALFFSWSILQYIASQYLDPTTATETPENVASDLIDLSSGPRERSEELTTLVAAVRDYTTKERASIRAKEFGRLVVPRVYEFNGVVDIRAVFDRESPSKDAGYKPVLLGVLPTVMLQFQTTSNSNDEIVIQLNEDQLDQLIAKLSNLKKELAITKASLNLKS